MNCLVYAIMKSEEQELPDLVGLNGERLRYLARTGIFAAYTTVEVVAGPEIDSVLKFEEVVEALFSTHPIIPVRFGNYFDSRERLERFLDENAAELAKLLNKLSGKAEMGIRVLTADQEQTKTTQGAMSPTITKGESGGFTSGREYLAARKALYGARGMHSEQKEQIMHLLETIFQGLFTDVVIEERSANFSSLQQHEGKGDLHVALSAYFLVPRPLIESFRRKFPELAAEGAKFLLSGPWPPYNFSSFEIAVEKINRAQ